MPFVISLPWYRRASFEFSSVGRIFVEYLAACLREGATLRFKMSVFPLQLVRYKPEPFSLFARPCLIVLLFALCYPRLRWQVEEALVRPERRCFVLLHCPAAPR